LGRRTSFGTSSWILIMTPLVFIARRVTCLLAPLFWSDASSTIAGSGASQGRITRTTAAAAATPSSSTALTQSSGSGHGAMALTQQDLAGGVGMSSTTPVIPAGCDDLEVEYGNVDDEEQEDIIMPDEGSKPTGRGTMLDDGSTSLAAPVRSACDPEIEYDSA
jgi:hypothetical protein